MLVQTFISYRDARQAFVSEASAVLTQSRAAALLGDSASKEVQQSLAYHTRSVVNDEWPSMDRRRSSPLPDHWAETRLAAVRRGRAGARRLPRDR